MFLMNTRACAAVKKLHDSATRFQHWHAATRLATIPRTDASTYATAYHTIRGKKVWRHVLWPSCQNESRCDVEVELCRDLVDVHLQSYAADEPLEPQPETLEAL